MPIPIFLSYPSPHVEAQVTFMEELRETLRGRGMEPRTLGVNEWDNDAPLTAIRRLMLESSGLITVALRRLWVGQGASKKGADREGAEESRVVDTWLTSPYCQIEPAMAFQLGLPVLVLRERGVRAEGILERGVVGTYMPEFSLEHGSEYLRSPEWSQLIGGWEGQVRQVVAAKGRPPRLFG